MALRSQLIEIPVGGGVDERVAAKHRPGGKYRSLVNARFPKAGEAEKRPGNAIFLNTQDSAELWDTGYGRLYAFGSQLLFSDGYRLAAGSTVANDFITKDQVSEAVVTVAGVASTAGAVHSLDMAAGGGWIMSVWCDTEYPAVGDIFYSLREYATGAEYVSAARLTTAGTFYAPRVIYAGGQFFVFYLENATNNIKVHRSVADTTLGTASNLRTDNGAFAQSYDVTPLTGTSNFVLVQTTNGATPNLKAYIYNNANPPVLQSTATSSEANGGQAVSVHASVSGRIWIGYAYTSGANTTWRVTHFNGALTEQAGFPKTLLTRTTAFESHCTINPLDNGTNCAVLFSTKRTASTMLYAPIVDTSATILATADNRVTYHVLLASRPFLQSKSGDFFSLARGYCWVYAGGARTTARVADSPYSYVLVDIGVDDVTTAILPARPVAISHPRAASNPIFDTVPFLVSVMSPATNVWVSGARAKKSNAGRSSMELVSADFASSTRLRGAYLGGCLYLSGGIPSVFDGQRVCESGFLYDPDVTTAAPFTAVNAAQAGGMDNGTRNYVIVYVWANELGQVIRSSPSSPVSATASQGAGNNKHTLSLPCLNLTTRQDAAGSFRPQVGIEVYRTTAAAQSGPYYLVHSEIDTPKNDPTAETISYVDKATDTAIATSPQLYTRLNGTQQSTLENVQAPCFLDVLAHRGALWGIDPGGRQVWVSKPFVDGEQVAFTDDNVLPIAEDAALVALAPLDEVVIAFSRSRIYAIDGAVPSGAAGDAGSLSVRRVSSDFGCINPDSVVVLPVGLGFQADGGYYILDRGLNVITTFSFPVVDTLAANPTISSAVVHPTGQYLLITCHAGGTTGVRLAFDYTSPPDDPLWSVDHLHGRDTADVKSISSVVVAGALYWLDKDGQVYVETPARWLDAYNTSLATGEWIAFSGELGEIHLNTMQGYQRVWFAHLLGTRYTAHDLTLEVAVDYSDAWQTKTWADSLISTWPLEQARLDIVKQFGQSIRVRFSDATPTGGASVGTGRGFAVSSIVLDVGVERGAYRLPPAQRA